ncbi:MAG: hypothetical protein WBP79_05210 [Candidatus Acidiferrales bacterium]
MSETSPASTIERPPRRSTRLSKAIPLTVMGVDSWRGPYREQVSTLTISCHGCKYDSKNQVLENSLVILEFKGDKQGAPTVSARGRVKWIKRLDESGGLFQTAIEFEDPGNIWGVETPPKDWLPFNGPRKLEMDTSKSKPFAVPRPEPTAAPVAEAKTANATRPRNVESAPAAPAASRAAGGAMGDFQQQMMKILSEAAASAVKERAAAALEDMRAVLRDEAKKILAEAASTQAGPWAEQSLKQFKQAGQQAAQALHAQWSKKMEADLAKAVERIEVRDREFEELAQSLSANALERFQRAVETTRRDAVDRIVSRLKEHLAPVLDDAQKVTEELAKRKAEAEKALDESLEKSSTRIEEACSRFEKQFEMILRERIDSARGDFEQAGKATTKEVLKNLSAASEKREAEAQDRLREALNSISQEALKALQEDATETKRQFAGELSHYSRSHLEFVSSAITELAKGLGKISKE